jgi:hypothetical protein
MKNIIYLAITVILFLHMSVFAGTIDPYTPDSKYIEYGTKFHNVVPICGVYKNNSEFCASAVIIDPHHILTAAHVVKNSKKCLVKIGETKYCIVEIIAHKDFDDKHFGLNDIAIGYCDRKMDMDFYPELYDQKDEVDKVCSISGFGLTGTFKTGAIISDNKRRAGSNIIDRVEKHLLICSPSPGKYRRTELEFLICSGDSGGGLFIDGKLAGINSCVLANGTTPPKSDYATESGHTRISEHLDWIKQNLKKK